MNVSNKLFVLCGFMEIHSSQLIAALI